MIEAVAPAKVNLFLHVGAVRPDGLHDLFSLFFFADAGDRLRVEAANEISLTVDGPFAPALEGLAPENNLVWQAADKLRKFAGLDGGAAISLEKNLPIAAGIGGGSADAAAALLALARLWEIDVSSAALNALAFKLGADVPACLGGKPVLVSGAGEKIDPGPSLPPLWTVLVNPRIETPTGPVFRAFDAANPTPASPIISVPSAFQDHGALAHFIGETRNDLEPHAIEAAPVIRDVLDQLSASDGVIAARMSGSGATCFGLYESQPAADDAMRLAQEEGWWSIAAPVVS